MKLPHERLDVYGLYIETAGLCSDLMASANQHIAAFDHLDRAIESIGVNLIYGNGHPIGSAARANCLDISIASTNECAACLDVCVARRILGKDVQATGMQKLWRIRGMLLGLKRAGTDHVQEDRALYGTPRFPFSSLEMYQASLRCVRWMHDFLADVQPKARIQQRLDISTTGTVLNIAEGHGRKAEVDQNRFMKIAQQHAYQTLVILDILSARGKGTESGVDEGKSAQSRVIAMLHAWCDRHKNKQVSETYR